MTVSVLAAIVVIAVLCAVLGVVNPVAGAIIAIVAAVPVAFLLAARMFRHAGPGPAAATRGPYVPSTSEASYQPADDPRERM